MFRWRRQTLLYKSFSGRGRAGEGGTLNREARFLKTLPFYLGRTGGWACSLAQAAGMALGCPGTPGTPWPYGPHGPNRGRRAEQARAGPGRPGRAQADPGRPGRPGQARVRPDRPSKMHIVSVSALLHAFTRVGGGPSRVLMRGRHKGKGSSSPRPFSLSVHLRNIDDAIK